MSRAAIAVSALVFILLALLLPSVYATPDESKYIGLGLNILDGLGLHTDFGVLFLNHSPVWPLVLATPQRLLGVEALAVGHVVDALAGGALIALTGALGWRHRPLAGAIGAIGLLGLPMLLALSRSAGLDVPAAALTLGYLWLAWRAIHDDSAIEGLLAGFVFAMAFLVKETALPVLPVPFLVALFETASLAVIGRVAAATLAATAVTMSWWFVLVAEQGGVVYRLGTPGWTLLPLAAVLVLLIVLGWSAGWIMSRDRPAALSSTLSRARVTRFRALAAWIGILGWTGTQLAVYARAPKLLGEPLLRASQLTDDLRVYGVSLAIALAFGGIGSLLALASFRRSAAVRLLAFGFVSGVPLILLVLGIGETTRHYVAYLALLMGLGAVGWVEAASAAASSRAWRAVLLVAVVLAIGIGQLGLPGGRLVHAGLVGAAVVVAIGVALAAFARSRPAVTHRPLRTATGLGATLAVLTIVAGTVTGVAAARVPDTLTVIQREAVDDATAWVGEHAASGDVIAVSPALGYHLAVRIRDHEVVRISPQTAIVDPSAPLGLRLPHVGPLTDPVTLDAAKRNVDQVSTFGADELAADLASAGVDLWIVAAYVSPGTTESAVQSMLDATGGLERARSWRFDRGVRHLVVVIYRVTGPEVSPPRDRTWGSPDAVAGVADRLAGAGAAAAARLAERIVMVPDNAAGQAALDRLQAVASGAP